MKCKSYILFLLVLQTSILSQQMPLHSLYNTNKFLINPAVAGYNHCEDFRINSLNQLSGFTESPKTQSVTFHTRIERVGKYDHSGNLKRDKALKRSGRVGLGGYIFSDSNGPFKRTGASFAYAYHLIFDKIENKNLSFGLSFGLYQYNFSGNIEDISLLSDNTVAHAKEPILMPESNFGCYYYSTNFFYSFSITQLFGNSIKFSGKEGIEYNSKSRFYLGGGYKFSLNEFTMFSGSIFLKTYETKRFQVDINPKIYFKSDYWFGLSLRTGNSTQYSVGYKFSKISLAYTYIRSFGDINNYSNGNHAIMIAFIFNAKRSIDNFL